MVYTWDIWNWVTSLRCPRQMTSTKFWYQSRYRLGMVYTCNIHTGIYLYGIYLQMSQVYTNNLLRYIWYMTCHVSHIRYMTYIYWYMTLLISFISFICQVYICIKAFTRRLMLWSRTRTHSPRPASNHIAWSYWDCYTLDWTVFASSRSAHVPVRVGSAAEKCWHSSCCTGGTNIPLLRSAASTMRHCASKEQYDSRVNGKEYTLITKAKFEIWHI